MIKLKPGQSCPHPYDRDLVIEYVWDGLQTDDEAEPDDEDEDLLVALESDGDCDAEDPEDYGV